MSEKGENFYKKIFLVGNPNVGKTTIFNRLTKSSEHTGNWHGVTVDVKSKIVDIKKYYFEKKSQFKNGKILVTDLPGLYNLTSYSFEEEVASREILKEAKNGVFFNVLDSNILGKNLYLTLGLLEAGIKPILVLNFFEESKARGIKIDTKKLGEILGLTVVKSEELANEKLVEILEQNNDRNGTDIASKMLDNKLKYFDELPIEKIEELILPCVRNLADYSKKYLCIKVLEEDENIIEKLRLDERQKSEIERIKKEGINEWKKGKIEDLKFGVEGPKNYKEILAKLRYDFIDEIIAESIDNTCENKQSFYHKFCKKNNMFKKDKREVKREDKKGVKIMAYGDNKIDKILLNKWLCLPIFLSIMLGIFYLNFSSVGVFISAQIKGAINAIFEPLILFLGDIGTPRWILGLFYNGIVCGVGGILSFLPQIVILFLFLSILEDSGYMSRVAFFLEDIFYSFGLSGKSVYTVVMSFGCSTTAVMTARAIEDKNTKIKTAMICPYLSCSAKLPIYAVICGAFFSKGNFFIVATLYFLGIVIALFVALILNKTNLKSEERSFVLEFPPYRMPSGKKILKIIFDNVKSFLVKVGTIILGFSVIVYILQNFSFDFSFVPDCLDKKSMLQVIGEFLLPIFRPVGLNNWGIIASLIVGVLAKEMVVGTMAIINRIPTSSNFDRDLGLSLMAGSGFVITLTPITAIVFMVFSLLYLPCISTFSVMKKEIGLKRTVLSCLIQFGICYLICFVLYNFLVGGYLKKVLILGCVIGTVVLMSAKKKRIKRIGCIGYCGKCRVMRMNCLEDK